MLALLQSSTLVVLDPRWGAIFTPHRPPGADNSMLAWRLTTILPAMTLAEAIETTRIHRVAGLTGDRTACVTVYPASV